ncbi:hypothetical protein Trydic_g20725 [Trypoxylus dichotomus]
MTPSKTKEDCDAIRTILHLKWNWAGHVARLTDGRWTKRILQWRPRSEAYRSRGRCEKSRWKLGTGRAAPEEMAEYKIGLCSAVGSIS